MKKKNYLLLATAAIALVACTADDDLSAGKSTTAQGDGAIMFNMETPASTRAGQKQGSEAAGLLNSEFIVWGEKNEPTSGSAAVTLGNGNVVFENYVVNYTASSAFSTTSNTKDWEYVGKTPYVATKVSPSILTDNSSAKQTIKYWDFNTPYTFTAVSALPGDISGDKVKITKKFEGSTAATKGYEIVLSSGASTKDIYVSDRLTKTLTTKSATADLDAVTLTFRNFQSKIRFGIYEAVPGYKAVITGIKYGTSDEHLATGNDKTFGINGDFLSAADGIKYTVTYDSNNKAVVAASGTSTTKSPLNTEGTVWLTTTWTKGSTTEKGISETSTSPTYDKTDGAYTGILPNPNNTTDMTLQIKFNLYSDDTGELIEEDYKTVTVPAEYCQWKSNYAYTYLFKITDKSADLYPITFDAVVETEEYTGEQETITTVDDPSITTYVKGKVASAYAAGDEIYAFGEDGSTTEMSASNMKLYSVTTTDNFEITESSVKHALEQAGKQNVTTKITATEIKSDDDSYTEQDKPTYVAIPREDTSDNRTITGMKWKAKASTTYAVEYIKTVNNTTTKYYKIVKVQ